MIFLRRILKVPFKNNSIVGFCTISSMPSIKQVIDRFENSKTKKKNHLQYLKIVLKDINNFSSQQKQLFYMYILKGCMIKKFSTKLILYLKQNNYFQQIPYITIQTNLILIQKTQDHSKKELLFLEIYQHLLYINDKNTYSNYSASVDAKYAKFLKQSNPQLALKLFNRSIKTYIELLKLENEQFSKIEVNQSKEDHQNQQTTSQNLKKILLQMIQSIINSCIQCSDIEYKKLNVNSAERYIMEGFDIINKYASIPKEHCSCYYIIKKFEIETKLKFKTQKKQKIVSEIQQICAHLKSIIENEEDINQIDLALHLFSFRTLIFQIKKQSNQKLTQFLAQNEQYIYQIFSDKPQTISTLKQYIALLKINMCNQQN